MFTLNSNQLANRSVATKHLGGSLSKKLAKLPVLTLPAFESKRFMEGTVTVKIRGTKNHFTIVKMILSYFIHTQDNFSSITRSLFVSHLEAHMNKMKDPGYRRKFFSVTQQLEGLIQLYLKSKISHVELVKPSLLRYQDLLPSPESMYGYIKNLSRNITQYFTRFRSLRPQRLPPKRYIGVGYKDKGNLRFSSFDGTPDWREVALTQESTEREVYYKTILNVSFESIILEREILIEDECNRKVGPWVRTQLC